MGARGSYLALPARTLAESRQSPDAQRRARRRSQRTGFDVQASTRCAESTTAWRRQKPLDVLNLDVIAEELSKIGESPRNLEARILEVERVNARLEDAALTTARALGESCHWNAVYEAMRRRDNRRTP